MVFSSDLFVEIRHFLFYHLKDEKLSTICRLKLNDILKKLEEYYASEKDVYDDYYEEPIKGDAKTLNVNFELPTKSDKSRNDRQSVTLHGPLYYRYNSQCWEHYPFSVLVDGRLICSKSSPPHTPIVDNTPNSNKNSEPSIFLMGYSGIMIGKDCGMNFVFKVTHPTEDMKVFATDTEEESLAWIEQINLYAVGSTPTEVQIFPYHSDTVKKPLGNVDDVDHSSSGSQCSLVDGDVKKYESAHLRRQPSEMLNVINNSTISNPNFLISDVKFNRSRSSYNFKQTNGTNNQNNVPYNFSGGLTSSGGGNSIVSSMRRKVESFSNKYRNRKSFAGFNTKGYNITNNSVAIKSKTISVIPQDDTRRASMYCGQFMSTSSDTIYKGIAKLRVHGNKSGWIERWCQLKPKLLECYHITPNGFKLTLDFALCLEDLTLGLSNDKKHKSALRLSCDSIKQDLLFEVQDKVLMGDWIKSFIEALGISTHKKSPRTGCDVPRSSILSERDDIKEDELMQRSITTIVSCASESVYDEVCPCDGKGADLLSPLLTNSSFVNLRSQRRWSSPIIESTSINGLQPPSAPYSGRRCLKDHPLPSLPASSPDSENNSDTFSDTPTGDDHTEIESLYDYSTTTSSNLKSCNSTLTTKNKNPTYPFADTCLKSNIIYADQDPNNIGDHNDIGNPSLKFNRNKELWRLQGCSLADLIARFEPQSQSQETLFATMSSKTDSSCTPTHLHSSEDYLNSISTSFISFNSFDRFSNSNVRKVSRSLSADNNLGIRSSAYKRDRPHSLFMKKTSLELVFEELSATKESLRSLNKQRKELHKALSQKTFSETKSSENIRSMIKDVTYEISSKEIRLKELSSHSRMKFTVELAPVVAGQ